MRCTTASTWPSPSGNTRPSSPPIIASCAHCRRAGSTSRSSTYEPSEVDSDGRSGAGILEGLQHLLGTEEIERVRLDAHVTHDAVLVEDEVRALRVPVDRALLVRDDDVPGR